MIYAIILILSVLLHELGHLLMALFWNVKVKACSFGFGKVLLHKKWKGIDWRISLIPLGGYCDIEEELDKPNSLYSISYWKQLTIILAGVFVNLLIAFVCYLIQYGSIIKGIMYDSIIIQAFLTKDYYLFSLIVWNIPNVYLLQCSLVNITLAISNLLPLPDAGRCAYLWHHPRRHRRRR